MRIKNHFAQIGGLWFLEGFDGTIVVAPSWTEAYSIWLAGRMEA